jgi:O-antigen biosynthesis protein
MSITPQVDADSSTKPVQLHIIHDLGGGTVTWLRDFCEADASRKNLVLKSFTHNGAMGCGVALYQSVLDETPVRMWHFNEEIQATVVTHKEYSRVLAEILQTYSIAVLYVSSIIGHSMDVLMTELPTIIINHDYFPYCPSINIFFGDVCKNCDGRRIEQCHKENSDFNPFKEFRPDERIKVREQFVTVVKRKNVTMVTPSQSVRRYLVQLEPRFESASFVDIPHGYAGELKRLDAPPPSSDGQLRILVLGQLSAHKGIELLRGSLEELTKFADLYLIGCREMGESFRFKSGVHILENYRVEELPNHVAAINPHVGLLMSVVPETFNYALTELMMLGVPVAATRLGSFAERITHHENGYLYDPNVASLLVAMGSINNDRKLLANIREKLRGWTPKSAIAMVADYHRIADLKSPIAAQEPLREKMENKQTLEISEQDQIRLTQSLTIASMWKDIKSLNLHLSMINRSREELSTELDRAKNSLQPLQKQLDELLSCTSEQQNALALLNTQTQLLDSRLIEIQSSTSWRITRPVRAVGHFLRRLRILTRSLMQLLRDPVSAPKNFGRLFRTWRSGGLPAMLGALKGVQIAPSPVDAWRIRRESFSENVKPQITRRIREMRTKPKISIIVPTYNTPEFMLREMLASVTAQLYPEWELCVADDGSDQPHVRRVLEEYAAKEARIKLYFGSKNKGVSHASNRALEMASGEYALLLDHDDLLEEHASFRVAQCIIEDKPDIVYSDEALVSADLAQVLRYAFRQAFSPEFLRLQPYIVHLVGFKTELIRAIGGFDESLKISQDYDLLLRASEKSKTIVHIPEILYQWRTHTVSAGHQKMDEVMEVSRSVLQHHLERCGEQAYVTDGVGFNLFDVRYPLSEKLRVAIIIPTKNHGELLRQCIDSIRATVLKTKYDIVVIDHESDDKETLAYLSSISGEVRVLHYKGTFNFSAMNNWAVEQIKEPYSHYLLCNNDIEAIGQGWLERMLELGQRPSIGIVGAKLLYPDRKTIQHAGVCVGAFGAAEHYGKFLRFPDDPMEPGVEQILLCTREVSAVTAACLLIRKDVFEKINGFDENLAVGFGDVDLCLKVREQGFTILYCPYAELIHHESYTRGKSSSDPHPKDSALFKAKWQKFLAYGDPYYHPALSLVSTSLQMSNPLHCEFDIKRRVFKRDNKTGTQKILIE